MAMMDQVELAKVIDFKKLKKANSLLFKWAQRFGISKNKFVRWAIALPKNYDEHKKLLPIPLRSAFSKEKNVMFYAGQVQSILVDQYSQMIHKILKYINISKCNEKYEDMYSEGLIAIMYATWSYRNVGNKCSFTTFCYNTLFMRLRGIKFKEYKKEKRRGDKVNIYFESDRSEQLSLSDHAAKQIDPIDFVEPVDIVLNKLIYAANLDEADAFLIKAFSNRKERLEKGVWYKEFSEKFTHTFKLNRITKQGLQQRVKRIHAKIWFHYKKMYGDSTDLGVA
jgi:hypothetical protein